MKYALSINQREVVVGGHPLDLYDCAILDFLYSWSHAPNALRRMVDNDVFVWASKGLMLQQMPLLRQYSPKEKRYKQWQEGTLHKRLKMLEEGGYIKMQVYENRSWVALMPVVYSFYGPTVSRFEQAKLERKSKPKGVDTNPPLWADKGISKSTLGVDINPPYKNIEVKEVKKETLQRKEPELQQAENENPSTVIPPQEIKQVPAPLPYCNPPAVMSGDRVAGTISGWGQTIPWAEIKDQAPPAEPSFYWWFERYGKNAGQTKCEQIWSQHVHSWAEIAWHTVFFTYFRTTDKTMVPDPLKYLREFKYRDDIDDRRPKEKVKPAEEVVPNSSTPPTKLEIF